MSNLVDVVNLRVVMDATSGSALRWEWLGLVRWRGRRHNALVETVIGLFKTEEIHRRGPWKGLEDVEFATLE